MAKVNFNNIDDDSLNNNNNTPGSDVGFFTLKNDNDEAIVRFMCDSVDDFEILTVHDVKIGDRYRKVNCIRDPREPLDNCPLCKSGAKINQRFFIKMIRYYIEKDPTTGVQKVIPKAEVWERSTAYAKTLKSYLDNYGPLSDVICKIIRHGKAGDMSTTYEIVPNLSKVVFKDEIYVKDTSLFGTFQAFGTFVMDRNFDEIAQFVSTGAFPERQTQNSESVVSEGVTPRTYESAPQYASAPTAPTQPTYTQPAPQYVAPAPYTAPAQYEAAPQYTSPVPPQYPNSTPVPNDAVPRMPAQGWENTTAPVGGFERPARRY